MPQWQRVYLLCCGGVIGFALGYMLCDFAALPRLIYFPLEGRWVWSAEVAGPLPMPYLGTIVWGLVAAVVALAATAVAILVHKSPVGDLGLRLVGGWTVAAVLVCGGYYTWNLWPF